MTAKKLELAGYTAATGRAQVRSVCEIGSPECAQVQLVYREERGYVCWWTDVTALANADLPALQRLVQVLDSKIAQARIEGANNLRRQFAGMMGLPLLPEGD